VPPSEWVLDTWVLKTAQEIGDHRSLDALALLHELKSRHRVAVDHGYRILGEYFRHAPGNCHAGQWLRVVVSRSDRMMFRDGCLAAKNQHALLTDPHFDPADLIFVGVSARTADKLLVSEESDYSDPVKTYLLHELGVTVLSVADALARAHEP
jgi:hypothetical protein